MKLPIIRDVNRDGFWRFVISPPQADAMRPQTESDHEAMLQKPVKSPGAYSIRRKAVYVPTKANQPSGGHPDELVDTWLQGR